MSGGALTGTTRTVLASAFGVAAFAVLSRFAPPIVLQWEDLPGFLAGIAGAAVVGAGFASVARRRSHAWGLCLLRPPAGALLGYALFLRPLLGAQDPGLASPSEYLVGAMIGVFYVPTCCAGAALAMWASRSGGREPGA